MDLFYTKGISLFAVSGAAGYLFPPDTSDPLHTANRFAADRAAAHILSLMADGRLEPKRLITHRMHYSQMVEAYEMAYHREKSMLGVIFDWRE
jgi:threonine dehydrogenase-like Zn-dependent dehydrogenase